jgi:hypothetical protein
VHMNPEMTESFGFPRTRESQEAAPDRTAPVRASLWVPAVDSSATVCPQGPGVPRQINWNRVLGLAAVLAVSAAAWVAVAVALEHVWK